MYLPALDLGEHHLSNQDTAPGSVHRKCCPAFEENRSHCVRCPNEFSVFSGPGKSYGDVMTVRSNVLSKYESHEKNKEHLKEKIIIE